MIQDADSRLASAMSSVPRKTTRTPHARMYCRRALIGTYVGALLFRAGLIALCCAHGRGSTTCWLSETGVCFLLLVVCAEAGAKIKVFASRKYIKKGSQKRKSVQ